jgi:hypothetical protein
MRCEFPPVAVGQVALCVYCGRPVRYRGRPNVAACRSSQPRPRTTKTRKPGDDPVSRFRRRLGKHCRRYVPQVLAQAVLRLDHCAQNQCGNWGGWLGCRELVGCSGCRVYLSRLAVGRCAHWPPELQDLPAIAAGGEEL